MLYWLLDQILPNVYVYYYSPLGIFPYKKRELQTDHLQYQVYMLEITGSARD